MYSRIFQVVEKNSTTKEKVFLIKVHESIRASDETIQIALAQFIANNKTVLAAYDNIALIEQYDESNSLRYKLGTENNEDAVFQIQKAVQPRQVRITRIASARNTIPDKAPHEKTTKTIPEKSDNNDVNDFIFTTLTDLPRPKRNVLNILTVNPPEQPLCLNGANIQSEADEPRYQAVLTRYGLPDKPPFQLALKNKLVPKKAEEKKAADDTLLATLKATAATLVSESPLDHQCILLKEIIGNITDEKLQEHKDDLIKSLAEARAQLRAAYQNENTYDQARQQINHRQAAAHQALIQLQNLVISTSGDHLCGNSIALLIYYRATLEYSLKIILKECIEYSLRELVKFDKAAWQTPYHRLAHQINTVFGHFATLTPSLTLTFDETHSLENLVRIANNILEATGSTLYARKGPGFYRIAIPHLAKLEFPFLLEAPFSGVDSLKTDASLTRLTQESKEHREAVLRLADKFLDEQTLSEDIKAHLISAVDKEALKLVEARLKQITEHSSKKVCDGLLTNQALVEGERALEKSISKIMELPAFDLVKDEKLFEGVDDHVRDVTLALLNAKLTLFKSTVGTIQAQFHYDQNESDSLDESVRILKRYEENLQTAKNNYDIEYEAIIQLLEQSRAKQVMLPPEEEPPALTNVIEESSSSEVEEETIATPDVTPVASRPATPIIIPQDPPTPNKALLFAKELVSPCTRLFTSFKEIPGLTWKRTAICVAAGVLVGAAVGTATFFLCPALVIPAIVGIGLAAAALLIVGAMAGVALHHKHTEKQKAIAELDARFTTPSLRT